MKKLSGLFYTCYNIAYETAGNDVNYAFEEDGSTLYIYFQGSHSTTDWIRNFLFKKRPYKDMAIPYKVHRGFLKAWKEVEDIIIEKVKETDESGSYRWKAVVVVGYSHGGALSGLCHECVWFHRPDLRIIGEGTGLIGVGFESPRFFGGYRVKDSLKERWSTYFVVRTNDDIVTHCPPALFRFCHVVSKSNLLKTKGDKSLVKGWYIPGCVKSHYPQVVEDGLERYEKEHEI